MATAIPPRLQQTLSFLEEPVIDHRSSDSEVESEDGGDIFRGEPPQTPALRTPRPPSVSSSSGSSSSSSSSGFAGRLGAISTIVEHAISHWARAWASTSSLSTSSSSSSSSSSSNSVTTRSRSMRRRRRRPRPSLADLHNAKSERDIAARIRARAESRAIPREFVLYTPPTIGPIPVGPSSSSEPGANGVLRTTSLPLINVKLSMALRDHMRSRRAQEHISRGGTPANAPEPPLLQHDYMLPGDLAPPSIVQALTLDERPRRRARKGKGRLGRLLERTASAPTLVKIPSERELNRAWWLDVSNPTWEDMRAIGKLLQLHPLTLEDILQQDPREKLELFPRLGYYFVSFRAIESRRVRARRNLISPLDGELDSRDEGIIGEVNVYLVVFREGICSFHFADISEHTDAVRNKVLMLDETVTMSSDWIAHGIMDSIVDSYFPYLHDIENEVLSIESVLVSTGTAIGYDAPAELSGTTIVSPGIEKSGQPDFDEKHHTSLAIKHEETYQSTIRTHFSIPKRRRSIKRQFNNMLHTLSTFLKNRLTSEQSPHTHNIVNTVRRMARTRRLVTSLTRFLAAKSEVVAQVKKRLLNTGEAGIGNGTHDDQDVFMYMGDVQDHILSLQQSLAHYERLLSQSHPTYLTELRISVSKGKSRSDNAIVYLTTISLGVLCVQTLIGLHSMNCNVPHNLIAAGGKFNMFGIIIALAIVILTVYGCVVRWWWVRAKRKRGRW